MDWIEPYVIRETLINQIVYLKFMGLIRIIKDTIIESRYIRSGKRFADHASWLEIENLGWFEHLLNEWEKAEEKYASRGYNTVNLYAFIGLAVYGRSIDGLLRQKLQKGERPIFFAKIYRERDLPRIRTLCA